MVIDDDFQNADPNAKTAIMQSPVEQPSSFKSVPAKQPAKIAQERFCLRTYYLDRSSDTHLLN